MSFKIGPLTIYLYGIILMLGALAAALMAEREARRRGQRSDLVWDGLIWVLIGGIIGARLWHVFTPTAVDIAEGRTTLQYLTHPLDLINTMKGGLGIPGAVIGGLIALYFFGRRNHLNFGMWVDIAAPGLALAQAIGRWGNYFNQELYGKPTTLPWAIHIDHPLPGYTQYSTFHPLFLYESIWNLGNMALLLWLGRRYSQRLKDGDLFLVYSIVYPVGRFLLDFLRLDSAMAGTLSINQIVMAIVAVLSAALLIYRHRQPSQAPIETTGSHSAE